MSEPRPDLLSLGADVQWPDHDSRTRTEQLLANRSQLGRLTEFATWLSAVQASSPPRPPGRVRAVVFGAATNATVDSVAAALGIGVRYEAEFDVDVDAAVAAGAALADDEVDRGADLLVVACPDTSVAAPTIVSILTDTEPVKVLARGAAATDPEAWMARTSEVRDLRRTAMALRTRPQELLGALHCPAFAAMAGFLLRAAARRTPVVLDGPAAAAAALVAYEAQPRAVRWWLAADTAREPGQELAMTKFGFRPLLDLGTALGDGTAGLLAVAILRAAVEHAAGVHDD